MKNSRSFILAFTSVFALFMILFPGISSLHGQGPSLNLKEDENIIFLPSYSFYDERSKLYHVRIHGWIIEPERDSIKRKALVAIMEKQLGIPHDETSSALFESRMAYFLVDQESRKQVAVELGGIVYNIGITNNTGHAERDIVLPAPLFFPIVGVKEEKGAEVTEGTMVEYFAVSRGDGRQFNGKSRFVSPQGVTIISDIDDTIKISEVLDRKKLIENTFIKPYQAVPGMAALYRSWAQKGADFHYLSASPWQLQIPLSEFMKGAGFPDGVFQMKYFGFPVNFMTLFDKPETVKIPYITLILKTLPGRKLVFVGDSGEKDPEIYGKIARENPGRVSHIFIRNVNGESRTSERMQIAFKGVDDNLWSLFNDVNEIKNVGIY